MNTDFSKSLNDFFANPDNVKEILDSLEKERIKEKEKFNRIKNKIENHPDFEIVFNQFKTFQNELERFGIIDILLYESVAHGPYTHYNFEVLPENNLILELYFNEKSKLNQLNIFYDMETKLLNVVNLDDTLCMDNHTINIINQILNIVNNINNIVDVSLNYASYINKFSNTLICVENLYRMNVDELDNTGFPPLMFTEVLDCV